MKKNILAVDIGNTSIAMGIFKGNSLFKKFSIPTNTKKSKIYPAIKKELAFLDIEAVIISSVVPNLSSCILGIFKNRLRINTFLVGRDIAVPVRNLYKKPKQVGQDRLVNAYACLKLYGAPAIIIDFGTATTFDYLNARGAYAGGLITPGVSISLDALAKRTALLPKIELKRPMSLLGKDTIDSMRSGVLYGLSSMCDGIVSRLKDKYSNKAKVVATGGLSSFFAPYCRSIDLIDKDLTLKGLLYIIKVKSAKKSL
ncbi:MAG: type III pantothenate kinase [Candidatus Omnitrophota bacterium]